MSDVTPVLEARGITRRFGGLTAVDAADLTVKTGELALLIGPNGAGKTTLLNCLSGVLAPDAGTVVATGQELTGRPAHVFAEHGVARTFQHARTFGGLTVVENVLVGAHHRMKSGWLRGALRLGATRREEAEAQDRARAILAEWDLGEVADSAVGDLTLHQERRLELARCLVAEPDVVLLDEPFAGLGDAESRELADRVDHVRDEHGVGVVLIEHHIDLALELADHVTVLNFGTVIAHGHPDEVRQDAVVRAAYIGGDAA